MRRRLAVAAALVLLPGVLAAQSDPRLVGALRLAQEGLGDSARAVTGRLLAATPVSDPLYPEILFTQATVAATAAERQRTLQRIMIEHAASPWADDALLQLAQIEYAAGNLPGAARQVERIRSDYPGSPVLAEAALWAARTYFDQRDAAAACGWLRDGLPRAGENVELRNQLEYYQQRCAPGAMAAAESTATPPSSTPAAAAAPKKTGERAARPSGPVYRIQVAAVSPVKAKRTTQEVQRKVKRLGYPVTSLEARNGTVRIRVGAFASKEAAQAALPKVRGAVGGKPFVVSDP